MKVSQETVTALLAAHQAEVERRAIAMPDETNALHLLFSAWLRLKELGWTEAMFCPKDGSPVRIIEAGSTGIHAARYHGTWPNGQWLVEDAGDLWPSTPILFKAEIAKSYREKIK